MKKAQRIAQEARMLAKVLERSGYTALRRSGLRSKRPDFPDYSCPSNAAPMSNVIAVPGVILTPPRSPKDAKRYPVQTPHKQGMMMFVPSDGLEFAGGKKP